MSLKLFHWSESVVFGNKKLEGDCSHVALGCELLDKQVGESWHKNAFHHFTVDPQMLPIYSSAWENRYTMHSIKPD
jgi:hypothetical protein